MLVNIRFEKCLLELDTIQWINCDDPYKYTEFLCILFWWISWLYWKCIWYI